MKIDFFYWGSMCPISDEIIQTLKKYDHAFDIFFHDFTEAPALAKKEKIFFPFLTVVNEKRRFYSPVSEKFLQSLLSGEMPTETPYKPALGATEKKADIRQITEKNYNLAAQCTGRKHCLGCERKAKMFSYGADGLIGFLNADGEHLLGGVECCPSLRVPYDIPKDKGTAFLTCLYLSDGQFDYKTAPLRALEQHLAGQYRRLAVISDEDGIFPNGNLAFFERVGYQDRGVVFEDEYCRLHFLSKELTVSIQ